MSRIDRSKRFLKDFPPSLPNPTHEIVLRNAGLPEQTELISFERNGERRSLLKSDMVYHHVAQGCLANEPYLITYCGLCNSGVGLTPLVQGRQHHFMAAGMTNGMAFLRDAESESYWDHMTGECFEGRLRGERMPFWPIEVTTVAGELATNGGAILLKSSDVPVPKGDRSWLRNGLRKMLQPQKEALSPKVARTMNGPFDERLPAHTLGLGVMDVAHQAKFYPVDVIPYGGQIEDRWQDRPLLITRPVATNGLPNAQWADSGTRPMQSVIRWYGFACTYPDCAIYHATGKSHNRWFSSRFFRKRNDSALTPCPAPTAAREEKSNSLPSPVEEGSEMGPELLRVNKASKTRQALMHEEQIASTLTAYIQTHFADHTSALPVTVETPLIQSGLIDSLSLFKLITFLQQQFGVKIAPTEVILENFATIQAIATLVGRKQQG